MKMTMMKLARMCEALENASTQKRKIEIIRESIRAFDCPELALQILANDLDSNNIGSGRAITWLAKMFGVFEDEIQAQADTWGDVAEGMHQFLDANEKNEKIGLLSFYNLITLDCSSINSDSYATISSIVPQLTNLEVKWFIRYWLRKPRHGVSYSLVIKALSKEFPDKNIGTLEYNTSIDALWNWGEHDVEIDSSRMLGHFIKPMLAKSYGGNNKLPVDYVIDIKYDGNRYQIHKVGDEVLIFSRSGKLVTDQFPDVAAQIKEVIKYDIILDCEILPVEYFDAEHIYWEPREHKRMATRVHSKDKQKAVQECPVACVVFDMLFHNGMDIMSDPYYFRLRQMDTWLWFDKLEAPLLYVASKYRPKKEDKEWEGFEWDKNFGIEAAYNIAINRGFEGVMIKDLHAKYEAGKRSAKLLKHKPPLVELDVVISSAKYGEGKRSMVFGTYGISVKEGDAYTHIGYVGTGLTDEELRRLTNQLKTIVEEYESDEWFFLPRVVLELRADLVSQDKDGNYSLRFPRVHRIRDDKFPADINTMDDLMRLS